MQRILGYLFMFLIGAVLVINTRATASAADTKSHEGKVVRVANGSLTMADKTGKNEHTHKVPATATITCDGKACKLEDLKKDFEVKVTTTNDEAATVQKIEAKSTTPK
jgi:hypothetical protein